ncbi:MAG: RNA-protein complex protein Nop10 [Euryarchaeota archaeon]|nr:RNA-protein complex protein Nop10 [Euryarchaeota archaeon]
MAGRMKKCPACSAYGLTDPCRVCGKKTASPHPARFSPEDHYGTYRRRLKRLAQLERREGS